MHEDGNEVWMQCGLRDVAPDDAGGDCLGSARISCAQFPRPASPQVFNSTKCVQIYQVAGEGWGYRSKARLKTRATVASVSSIQTETPNLPAVSFWVRICGVRTILGMRATVHIYAVLVEVGNMLAVNIRFFKE